MVHENRDRTLTDEEFANLCREDNREIEHGPETPIKLDLAKIYQEQKKKQEEEQKKKKDEEDEDGRKKEKGGGRKEGLVELIIMISCDLHGDKVFYKLNCLLLSQSLLHMSQK